MQVRSIREGMVIPDRIGRGQKAGAHVSTSDVLSTLYLWVPKKRRRISRASELLAVCQHGLCSMEKGYTSLK